MIYLISDMAMKFVHFFVHAINVMHNEKQLTQVGSKKAYFSFNNQLLNICI